MYKLMFDEAKVVGAAAEAFLKEHLGDPDWDRVQQALQGMTVYPGEERPRFMLVFREGDSVIELFRWLDGLTFPYEFKGERKSANISLEARPQAKLL